MKASLKFSKKQLVWIFQFLITGIVLSGCQNSFLTQDESLESQGVPKQIDMTVSSETQCLIFKYIQNDYLSCLSCKSSLCGNTNLNSCSVNMNQLAKCVHDNENNNGGTCVGLTCGEGQIADFATCTCQDNVPPASLGNAPGYKDQTTPYLKPGFTITNRYCPAADSHPDANPWDCLKEDAGASGNYQGTRPRHDTLPPINIIQDVGYMRWDLALDASQYSPYLPLKEKLPFLASNATFPINMSLNWDLKPNTSLKANTVPWIDCAEHFSGYLQNNNLYLSSNSSCYARNAAGEDLPAATQSVPVLLEKTTTATGVARQQQVSANGTSANRNLIDYMLNIPGNTHLRTSCFTAGGTDCPNEDKLGLAKENDDSVTGISTGSAAGTGLFSNIGYYKYTWGPFQVTKTGSNSVLAEGSVSSQIAVNMNLGFNPVSAVNSSALSDEALTTNTVSTRDCTVTTSPHPCVTTVVQRTAGGAVLYQSFSSNNKANFDAGPVGALPPGVIAASTPKIIEDTTQLTRSNTGGEKKPARLRVFVRSTDGNIYMSRFNNGKWNTWMSLGRPWTCKNSVTDTGCDDLQTGGIIQPIYAPVNINNSGVTGSPNDGLSIVGEPMIASIMDSTAAGSTTVIQGAIAIFVRVSQFNSSDGSYGPYHNSIFYTVGFGGYNNTEESINVTLDLDNPASWTNWMPVRDASIRNFQGNPAVFMKNHGGTNYIYLFGTSSEGNLHPPIAPSSAENETLHTGAMQAGWYNYGQTLLRSRLDLSSIDITAWTHTDYVQWSNFASQNIGDPVVSNWTWVPVDPSTANSLPAEKVSSFTHVRLLATALISHSHLFCLPLTTDPRSPCQYDRELVYREFELDNGDASGSGPSCLGAGSEGSYTYIKPYGDINGLNLGDIDYGSNGNPNSASADRRLYLFGRAVCTKKSFCDNVNPAVFIAAIRSTSECATAMGVKNHDIYYSTYDVNYNEATTDSTQGSKHLVTPFPVSSDVVPIQSFAKEAEENDVPLYFFTRDRFGNLGVGQFEGYKNLQEGARFFNIQTKGGFLN